MSDLPTRLDITPPALTTPEGRARVDKAVQAFKDAQTHAANTAANFFKTFGDVLATPPRDLTADDRDYYTNDYSEVAEAFANLRATEEAFLRSLQATPAERATIDVPKGPQI